MSVKVTLAPKDETELVGGEMVSLYTLRFGK